MKPEKALSVLSKLVRAKDTMKDFWGDKYQDTIVPYQELIKKHMKNTGSDEIKSLMDILEDLQKKNIGGMTQALLIAATVEMTMEQDENTGDTDRVGCHYKEHN